MENLVEGNLLTLFKARGIQLDDVSSRVKVPGGEARILLAEYDLVAESDETVLAVEVKTTLLKKDVDKFLSNMENFRNHFLGYKNKVVYGAIAYMKAGDDEEEKDSAEYAMEKSLFVIKAPGGEADMSEIINPEDFSPRKF